LYGRGVPLALTAQETATAIERTDGTTASFLKELIRRAVLEALHEKALHEKALHEKALRQEAVRQESVRQEAGHGDPALSAVTGAHLARALDDLLDSAQVVTRTLLGVGANPEDLPAGGALSAGPMP